VYDEAKRFAEAMTMAYNRSHGLATRIVRIFNTYGPRMRLRDGRAIPNFITQALRGEPITIYGDGSQTRSFTFVDDLVRGILLLLESDECEPVNLGNPEEVTIREMAQAVLELTGSGSALIEEPLPVDDPKVRCPDITRARTILSWQPRVTLREGLVPTIAWFKQQVAGQER
jgi:dTDP-glucose 4,6-dehydratase